MEGHELQLAALGGVGVISASGRAHVVDAAEIVAAEEGAGGGGHDAVAVGIGAEVALGEFGGAHTQVARNAVGVGAGEQRGGGLAAVGAAGAVVAALGDVEGLMVELLEFGIELARVAVLEDGDHALVRHRCLFGARGQIS